MRAAFIALLVLMACEAKIEANTQSNATSSKAVPPGPTPAVRGNHEVVELGEGRFEGDLVVSGNHNAVRGAGNGRTIIDGRLVMSGNHNTVSGMTIEKGGVLEGNHNDATRAEVHGDVTTSGNKNQN